MGKRVICTAGTSIARMEGIDSSLPVEAKVRAKLDILSKETEDDTELLKRVSAETHSLVSLGTEGSDEVHLLCTDSDLGTACATAVQSVIEKYLGIETEKTRIKGLQVDDPKTFRIYGIPNLFRKLDSLVETAWTHETILNVTGGFKSVVPYMTLFGIFRNVKVVYIFERSEKMLVLPPAPLNIDFDRASRISGFLIHLGEEGVLPKAEFERELEERGIPYSERPWFWNLVECADDLLAPSYFGQLVADENRIQESAHIYLSPHAEKSLKKDSGQSYKKKAKLLNNLRKPLWRKAHIEPGWAAQTDLKVMKPGNTNERAACHFEGTKVYVCELFGDHEDYERELPDRTLADYKLEEFERWDPAAYAVDIEQEEFEIEDETERLKQEKRQLIEDIEQIKHSSMKLANERDALSEENAELQEELSAYKGNRFLTAFKILFGQRPEIG